MNVKLITLTLCTLAANPALQAMKATRSLFSTARSLRGGLTSQINKQALTRIQFSQNNDRERFEQQADDTYGNLLMPGAVAAAVILNTQGDMTEEDSLLISKLDIYNVSIVLDVFKKGTENQKQLLAQKVAQKITYYKVEDIIALLQHTTGKSHNAITRALSYNITYYTNDQIIQILKGDLQDDTHAAIANSIKENLTMFIYGPSWYNVYSAERKKLEFQKLIEVINTKYHTIIMEPIAKNLLSYSFFDLGCLVRTFSEPSKEVLRGAIAHQWPQVLSKIEKTIFTQKEKAHQLVDLYEICNDQQKNQITDLIEQKLQLKDLPNNSEPLFLCQLYNICGEKTKAMIVENEIRMLERNGKKGFVLPYHDWMNSPFGQNLKDAINLKLTDELKNYIDFQPNQSVSDKHLQEHLFSTICRVREVAQNPKLLTAFNQALQHERSIKDTAHVFYHSQQNNLYWLELLYTKIWEHKHNQKASNYLFTRFYEDRTELSNAILQYASERIHQEILKTGRPDATKNWSLRPYLLFANSPLFGNSTTPGSNSVYYTLNNFNCGIPDINNKTIFDRFNLNMNYTKYASELDQINKEFLEIVRTNVLLQIAVPEEITNDYVYLAKPGGIQGSIVVDDQETKDVNSILKTAKSSAALPYKSIEDNFDRIEYCLVMTPDTIQKMQKEGVEVRVYGDFDQAKLNAVIAKLEALIARIAQENPQKFSSKLSPAQSYQAYKPVLDNLLQKKN